MHNRVHFDYLVLCLSSDIIPGSFNCIKLHKRGLYTGGTDGIVRRIILNSDSSATVVEKEDFGIPVSSLSFSSSHNKLAIGSVKVNILDSQLLNYLDIAGAVVYVFAYKRKCQPFLSRLRHQFSTPLAL